MPRASNRVGVEMDSAPQLSAELLRAKKAERRARARQRADNKRLKAQSQEPQQQSPQLVSVDHGDVMAIDVSSHAEQAPDHATALEDGARDTGDRSASEKTLLSPEAEELVHTTDDASKEQSMVHAELASLAQTSVEYGTEEVLNVDIYVSKLLLQQQHSVPAVDSPQAVATLSPPEDDNEASRSKTVKPKTKKTVKVKRQHQQQHVFEPHSADARAPSQDVAATTIQKALKRKFLKQCASFLRHSSKVFAAIDFVSSSSTGESDGMGGKCDAVGAAIVPQTAEQKEQQRQLHKPRAVSPRESSVSPVRGGSGEDGGDLAWRSEHAAKTDMKKKQKPHRRDSRPRRESSSSSSSSQSQSSSQASRNRSDSGSNGSDYGTNERPMSSSSRSSRSSRCSSTSSSEAPSQSLASSDAVAGPRRDSVRKKKRLAEGSARSSGEHNSDIQQSIELRPCVLANASDGPSAALFSDLQVASQPHADGAVKYNTERHRLAVIKIQAWLRGVDGRQHALIRRVEFEREMENEALCEIHDEASVRIQAIARGYIIRRQLDVRGKSPADIRADKAKVKTKAKKKGKNPRASIAAFFRGSDAAADESAAATMTATVPAAVIDESAHESVDDTNGADSNVDDDGSAASRRGSDEQEVAEWPTEFNLEGLDEWDELSSPANVHGDQVTHVHFLAKNKLRVFCGTWNMHAKKPQDDLRLWIPLNKYHVVAVGSEECVNSIAKSVVFTSKKQWENLLKDTLGEEYVLVSSHSLTAIHNIVFVHESVIPLLSNIQSDAVATGLGNQLGNKGGVGIAFSIGRTSLAFVNCHFDAHQHNTEKRNSNFHRINQELKLYPSQTNSVTSPALTPSSAAVTGTASLDGLGRKTVTRFSLTSSSSAANAALQAGVLGKKLAISECFDRVFWFGDLNYRINGTRRMVDLLLLRNEFEVLRFNDQLQIEMNQGNVFAHFHEGPLHFRPTYKFDKHSNVYDSSGKQRIPSWTDRILYLSNDKLGDIEILSYRSQMDFQTSDHRPVGAAFQVTFKGVHSDVGHGGRSSGAGDGGGVDQEFSRVLARGYKRDQAKSEVCSVQ